MSSNELQSFHHAWDQQAARVIEVMESLPAGCYDFRPDPEGRSLGETAWHLAELDAWITFWIERRGETGGERPPGIERPREVAALAPGYARVHAEAKARAAGWTPELFDQSLPFFDGKPHSVRELLWDATLHHSIHHLGQLVLLARQAGGKPPGIYGANREATVAMRAKPPAKG